MFILSGETTMDLISYLIDYQPFWDDYYRAMKLLGRGATDSHEPSKRISDIRNRSLCNATEGTLIRYLALKHLLKMHSDNERYIDVYQFKILKDAGLIE